MDPRQIIKFDHHGIATLLNVVCCIVLRLLLRAGQLNSGVQLESRFLRERREDTLSSWKDTGGGGRDHHKLARVLLSEEERENTCVASGVQLKVVVPSYEVLFESTLEGCR